VKSLANSILIDTATLYNHLDATLSGPARVHDNGLGIECICSCRLSNKAQVEFGAGSGIRPVQRYLECCALETRSVRCWTVDPSDLARFGIPRGALLRKRKHGGGYKSERHCAKRMTHIRVNEGMNVLKIDWSELNT
jgi:hypothetical protein